MAKVEPLQAFYPAESYHQDYATLHPDSTYIEVYDLPKISNLKTLYPDLYREQPMLVRGTPRSQTRRTRDWTKEWLAHDEDNIEFFRAKPRQIFAGRRFDDADVNPWMPGQIAAQQLRQKSRGR